MRSKMLSLLIAAGLVAGISTTAAAQGMSISGKILTSTWDQPTGPYHVVGSCTVAVGNTLTIDPGTEVGFDEAVEFVVEGVLNVMGDVHNPVGMAPYGGSGAWGGIRFVGSDSSTIRYAAIGGGQANVGGALYVGGTARVGLDHVSLILNFADVSGGGLYVDMGAVATMSNSIVWMNSPDGVFNNSGSLAIAYSDVQGGWDGVGNINIDPKVNLVAPDPGSLQTGSPCIDAGDPLFPTDPDGSVTDMGAIWSEPAAEPPPGGIQIGGAIINIDGATGAADYFDFSAGDTSADSTGQDYWADFRGTSNEMTNFGSENTQIPGNRLLRLHDAAAGVSLADVTVVPQWTDAAPWVATSWDFTYGTGGAPLTVGEIWVVYTREGNYALMEITEVSTAYPDYWFSFDYKYDPEGGNDFGEVIVPGFSGQILTDTWTAEGSPYNIAGACTVAASETLTIDVGAEVVFHAMAEFVVEGVLNIMGDVHNPVAIYPWNSSAASSIRFVGSTASTINYALIGGGQALMGGGIYVGGTAHVDMDHLSLVVNMAETGGGLYVDAGGTVVMSNSIVWSNTPDGVINAGSLSITYSDIQGGWDDVGNIMADPMFSDDTQGGFDLLEGSPAIDAGDPLFATDPDGTPTDMGAIYHNQSGPPPGIVGKIFTETWIGDNSPYHIAGPCTVVAGETLTIGGNVGVQFDANVPFVVEGNLMMPGTVDDPVVMWPGESPEWGGVRLLGAGPSMMSYTLIVGGHAEVGGGVYVGDGVQLGLDHVTIWNNRADQAGDAGGGLYADSGSVVVMANSVVADNSPDGIFVDPDAAVAISYSNTQMMWPGDGNISGGPIWADPMNIEAGLHPESPVIDAGDPTFPPDPDGSVTDMGVLWAGAFKPPPSGEVVFGSDSMYVGTTFGPGEWYFDFSVQYTTTDTTTSEFWADFRGTSNEGPNFGTEGMTVEENRFRLFSEVATLSGITSVPAWTDSPPWVSVSWQGDGTGGMPLSQGEIWIVYTREGHYAAMEITDVGADYFKFDYMYQPDGTTNFEAGPPPGPGPGIYESMIAIASDGDSLDLYGRSVAIDGDIAVVGAPRDDVAGAVDQGTAYILQRDETDWDKWNEVKKLTVNTGQGGGELFGRSVAISGDLVVIGAPGAMVGATEWQGAAYVYNRHAGGQDMWDQIGVLSATDGAMNDGFGRAVAIWDSVVVVGAEFADDAMGNPEAGAAYVFARNWGGTEVWGQAQKLVAAESGIEHHFGTSVDIDGYLAVVGADQKTTAGGLPGAAYLFGMSIDGVDSWGQMHQFAATDMDADIAFGASVALEGDVVAVGAPHANDGPTADVGAVYVYDRNWDGPDAWGSMAKLVGMEPMPGSLIGGSIALDGDLLVVGANQANTGEIPGPGKVCVYARHADGPESWGQIAMLTASDGAPGDHFGQAVAISKSTLLVGAMKADVGTMMLRDQGAAYFFETDFGPGDGDGEYAKLVAGEGAMPGDGLGFSVAIDGDMAVVGAPGADRGLAEQGAAYLYARDGTDRYKWHQIKMLLAGDLQAEAEFGQAVAIFDTVCIVTARGEDIDGNVSQGAAYVFCMNAGGPDNWGQVAKLTVTDNQQPHFGSSVALEGQTVVIGASFADPTGLTDQGTAFVFEQHAGGPDAWGQVAQLVADDGAESAQFGSSVAIAGSTIVVGAPGAQAYAPLDSIGAAYTFSRNMGGVDMWGQVSKLTPQGGMAGDEFGNAVDLSDNAAAVGAPGADGGVGAVYVFSEGVSTKLMLPDEPSLTFGGFGASVIMLGDVVLAGAPSTEMDGMGNAGVIGAWMVDSTTGAWQFIGGAGASDAGQDWYFGLAVGFSGTDVIVGAPGADGFTGAAYLYDTEGGGDGPGGYELSLPDMQAAAGEWIHFTVNAAGGDIQSANLAILIEGGLIDPMSISFVDHVFAGTMNGMAQVNVVGGMEGDTIFVAMASDEMRFLDHQPLVTLEMQIKPDVMDGVRWLGWAGEHTWVNESTDLMLNDGSLDVMSTIYGDVTDDGTVSAFDASYILRYNVRLETMIDERAADVSDNGYVTAFDAALILHRVVDPGFMFPVEGGHMPKLASGLPRMLSVVRDGAGWALVVNDPAGIVAGEITLAIPGDYTIVAEGEFLAYKQDGSKLQVAFARTDFESPTLFRLESDGPLGEAPRAIEAELNEGMVATIIRPTELTLAQNTPNPFNPSTTIRFAVPEASDVRLAIYSTTGQLVRTLVDGRVEAGYHTMVWSGNDATGREVASGVYIYRLSSAQGTLLKRMLLVK